MKTLYFILLSFLVAGCGTTTKAVVKNTEDKVTISITTSSSDNPTVTASPDVEVQVAPKNSSVITE